MPKGKEGFQKGNSFGACKRPWNKGLTKEDDLRIRASSGSFIEGHNINRGRASWNKGKHHTQDTKDLIGEASKERWKDPVYAKNSMQKSSEANETVRPNKPEQKVIEILKMLVSDIEYVGDGTHWVIGTGKNPDFVSEDKKLIIEVFGCFWHCCKKCGHPNRDNKRQKDALRVNEFRRLGYSVLVVWECELKHPEKIMLKIKKFIEVS